MIKPTDNEDSKLVIAALKSFQTGKLTPLLKEELKYSIQSRRLAEGKEELSVVFDEHEKPAHALRPDEIEKKERRKEQNRRAAARFRHKKKDEILDKQTLCSQLESKNKALREEIRGLKGQRSVLRQELAKILEQKGFKPEV